MASQPNYPTYPSQPGQPSYGWSIPTDQGPPPEYNTSQPQQQSAQPASNMYGGATGYESGDLGGAFSFSEKSIRMAFIRKVFAILMCQLAVTSAFIGLFVFHDGVKQYSRQHPEMWWITFALTFVLLIVLACCDGVRRRWPLNIILLSLFTLCEGVMLGSVATLYRADDVFIAAGICAVVCLALTIFAMQTKWDFTTCGGILFVAVIVLFIFGIISIIFPNKVLSMVYASIGALIFCCYLVFDVQLMMGGKHKYSISPEEYIFAALNLYLDIINIFLYLLQIVGGSRS